MRTKEQRQIANQKYAMRIKQRGLMTTTFIMPVAIRDDVKRFIETRSMNYALKQGKV